MLFYKRYCFLGIMYGVISLSACSDGGSGGGQDNLSLIDKKFLASSYTPAPDSSNLTGTWLLLETNRHTELTFPEEPLTDLVTLTVSEYSRRKIVHMIDNGNGSGSVDLCIGSDIQPVDITNNTVSFSLTYFPSIGFFRNEFVIDNNSRFGGDIDNSGVSWAGDNIKYEETGHIEAVKIDNLPNAPIGQLYNISGSHNGASTVTAESESVVCFDESYGRVTIYYADDSTTIIDPLSAREIVTDSFSIKFENREYNSELEVFLVDVESPWNDFKVTITNNPEYIDIGEASTEINSDAEDINGYFTVSNEGSSLSGDLLIQF